MSRTIRIHIMFIITACFSYALNLRAQELNCTVEFNTDQINGSNKSVFETLRTAVSEYMNSTRFTETQIADNERIECRLFFTIKEYNDDVMKGDLQVQLTRPVYNTNYTTTLINFKDTKIDFDYREGEPLVYSENSMENQLTAILNFYAFLFLAVDFDSFSREGGQPYFDRLGSIVQMAQSTGEQGWKAFEDNKNRSAVLAAFTDQSTRGLRDLLYDYHRVGLDEMAVSPDKGRQHITETLQNLKTVYEANPMSVGLSMFKDAKLNELVGIYSKAPAAEREKVYDLLSPIFPTENKMLDQIKAGKSQ